MFDRKMLKEYIMYSFEEDKEISNKNYIDFSKDGFERFNDVDVQNILKELFNEGILEFNKQLNYLNDKSYKIENMRFVEGSLD